MIVVKLPQSPVLSVFDHPSIQDRKQVDFLPLRFENPDHFKSDSGAFAHPSYVVGPVRLDAPHGPDVIRRDLFVLFRSVRSAGCAWAGTRRLKHVKGLIGPHVF